jgi:hypothetical protein
LSTLSEVIPLPCQIALVTDKLLQQGEVVVSLLPAWDWADFTRPSVSLNSIIGTRSWRSSGLMFRLLAGIRWPVYVCLEAGDNRL